MDGIIFDIKRFAVHDGPGIRTTVHFKGCPLKCQWCHNPEGISQEPFTFKRNIQLNKQSFSLEEIVGERYSADDLLYELMKDRVFWDESGGGITFSGGEPFNQFDFILEVAKEIRNQNIHLTIDTCGMVQPEKIDAIAPYTNLFLYDLKTINNKSHIDYTGRSNRLILKNLEHIIMHGYKTQVRIPVVPGKNHNNDNLIDYIKFLKALGVTNVCLLPYHAIADAKYMRFSIPNKMKGIPSLLKRELLPWKEKFEQAGFYVSLGE